MNPGLNEFIKLVGLSRKKLCCAALDDDNCFLKMEALLATQQIKASKKFRAGTGLVLNLKARA